MKESLSGMSAPFHGEIRNIWIFLFLLLQAKSIKVYLNMDMDHVTVSLITEVDSHTADTNQRAT